MSFVNFFGDLVIVSCYDGGSSYGKEDQEFKVDGFDDVFLQFLWFGDVGYGFLCIKEEQVLLFQYGGSELFFVKDGVVQNFFLEQSVGDVWQFMG